MTHIRLLKITAALVLPICFWSCEKTTLETTGGYNGVDLRIGCTSHTLTDSLIPQTDFTVTGYKSRSERASQSVPAFSLPSNSAQSVTIRILYASFSDSLFLHVESPGDSPTDVDFAFDKQHATTNITAIVEQQ